MMTLEACLRDLYVNRLITYEDALSKSSRPDDLKRMIDSVLV
jgi:Tfp pilus assembly pilus retraction ATPase PilT